LKPSRLHFADVFRGLLMIHMALDHASLFWNARRFADEFWWHGLPVPADLPNFIARFTGFPVAPGFAFMAGFMVAVTDAGRAARGQSENDIRRRLLLRAALLIGIELVFLSLAVGHVQIGVLTMLGAGLAITTFVRRAPAGALAAAALAIMALHPALRALWTDRMDAAGIAIKLIHQAGRFGSFEVYYPLFPWIGIVLFGVVAGRLYLKQGARGWLPAAAICAGAFLVLRLTGIGSAASSGDYKFWVWSKYPPDLSWLTASFAAIFAVLTLLERRQDGPVLRSPAGEFVATFGRVPLFFYATHFAVLWITRPSQPRELGTALLVWAAALALLWWPCRAWHRFKTGRRNRFQTSGAPV
jgi:uncharacterized membrane protein